MTAFAGPFEMDTVGHNWYPLADYLQTNGLKTAQ